MKDSIITLTTDFGLSDPFVGIMKGVMLSIAPEARLIDISQDIPSFDVAEAALIIDSAFRYFPAGTVHVVVVDPGVGSARRPIAAMAHGHVFVAPDNGILSYVLQAELVEVYHITSMGMCLQPVSRTFHGRDIFAPVAAHIARGAPVDSVGPRIIDYLVRGPGTRPAILRVDKFGNLITNLRRRDLAGEFAIRIAGLEVRRLLSNYDEAQPGEVFAIEGSTGFIELSVKLGSASKTLNAGRGAEIEVETGTIN